MMLASRTSLEGYLIGNQPTSRVGCTLEQAKQANKAFDAAVKQFLHDWIKDNHIPLLLSNVEGDLEEFIEQEALRSFFNLQENSVQKLLEQAN